eukprot:TRINITY_DN1813_c0_g1_i1.p1 TRINITY_DN1813_c0_g1~~TRINITY_DN1813_c0_g1_i1.p1  ORF type:complete len:482 (-),score=81.93 TRINITY_DN1813_c0_g1_i1:23-1468(-)
MSSKKRPASGEPKSPPAKKAKSFITPEEAAKEDGFKLIRSLDRNTLKPETIARLNTHNYDPLTKKKLQAKVIIRSGSISSKCELVRSNITKRPFKIIAKADISKSEYIGVYMGILLEQSECKGTNLWQYNILGSLFPKKCNIPSLVLDGSKASNETRFIHNASWYNKDPNVEHLVLWDVATHLPHIVYRTIKDIKAGEALLLEWGVYEPETAEKNPSNNNNNNAVIDSSADPELDEATQSKGKKEAQTKKQVAAEKAAAEKAAEKKRKEQETANKLKQKKEEEEIKRKEAALQGSRLKQQEEAERRKQEIKRKLEAEKLRSEEQRRAKEIAKTKRQLEEADRKNQDIERIKKGKEEEARRRSDEERNLREEAKNVNHGKVIVTKKHQANIEERATNPLQGENNLDEEQIEVEFLQVETSSHTSRPTTEINFFSETITTDNKPTPNSSVSNSIKYNLEDRTFDLNASISLSDEEEEEFVASL